MKPFRVLAFALSALLTSGLALADDPPAAAPAAAAPAAAAPAAAHAAAGKKDAKEKDSKQTDEEAEADDHTPVTFTVSVNVLRLSKLELGPGTFEGDFAVGFTCDKEPCKPKPHLTNGEIKGKPELLVNEPLHKLYRIKAELTADIDLGSFPFDEHVLMIQVGDHDALDVTIKPDEKAMSAKDEITLPGWEVSDIAHKIATEDLGGGLKDQALSYEITVKRPRVAAIAKNLLPALTMVLVLFISLVMKPKMAAPRLAAGTGSFVAVIMFHNTAANQLPPLGFLTLLDKFMFSLYVLWIIHIAFSIGILRADEAKNEELAMKFYRTAFIVMPLIAAVTWSLVLLRVV